VGGIRKRIAFMIHSLSPGGMERVMTELANHFSAREDVTVYLVMFGRSPELFYQINENIIVRKPERVFNDRFRNIESLKRLLFVRNEIKRIDPDSILSFGTHWNNFVLLALTGLDYPVFVSDRGSPVRKYSLRQRLMRKILYRRASGIIAQTETARKITLELIPGSNVKVIGNPIRIIDNRLPLHYREKIILSVGRLIDSKHHDRLIDIFSKLDAPGWQLVIVGGDALKQKNSGKLREQIIRLNLTGRVILEGEQADVDKYYRKSRLFAFTSSVEGFPNVIGEALSAGLPVVAYDCVAGPSEMITNAENGFLVPVFSDDVFREKLQVLIDDEGMMNRMSANAVNSVKKFSVCNIGQDFYTFLTSTTSRLN